MYTHSGFRRRWPVCPKQAGQRPDGTSTFSALVLAAALAWGLTACAATPLDTSKLTAARVAVQRAATLEDMTAAAKKDVDIAQANLLLAENAQKNGRPAAQVDQYAYIAEQSATAALARHESARLQKKVHAPGDKSERDARMALHKAETAEKEAARVQQLAGQQANEPR